MLASMIGVPRRFGAGVILMALAGQATRAQRSTTIEDDNQLAETLSLITQDPAIPVDDPATRALAQASMLEGVRQRHARSHDQALANFLEAYSRFPSPKILLEVASTLRDMGRLADAANTYQRCLAARAIGAARITAIVPHDEAPATDDAIVDDDTDVPITSGALAVLRIDGKGRGFAGGFGIAISGSHVDAEIMLLKADATGGYVGARYRLLTGSLRPYLALGMPAFIYDALDMGATNTTKNLAIGARAAIGIELEVSDHFSVHADLGWEHFFNVADTNYDDDLLIPSLGVIGRL